MPRIAKICQDPRCCEGIGENRVARAPAAESVNRPGDLPRGMAAQGQGAALINQALLLSGIPFGARPALRCCGAGENDQRQQEQERRNALPQQPSAESAAVHG
ncbi:hypothetical protein MTO96_017386 [Rhipicephalus appendiculatus]